MTSELMYQRSISFTDLLQKVRKKNWLTSRFFSQIKQNVPFISEKDDVGVLEEQYEDPIYIQKIAVSCIFKSLYFYSIA